MTKDLKSVLASADDADWLSQGNGCFLRETQGVTWSESETEGCTDPHMTLRLGSAVEGQAFEVAGPAG